MRIGELVGRHEMTNRSQPVQLLGQSLVELNRRMEEEVAIGKPHHGHAGRERKRQPDSAYSKIFEWAIDDADLRREWLIDVDWLVKGCTHVSARQYGAQWRNYPLQHRPAMCARCPLGYSNHGRPHAP